MFTYDLSSTDPLTVEIAKARFALGDTTEDRGPRANGTNISDEELTMVLDGQGTLGSANRPMMAVAALCDMLARDWSKVPSITAISRSQQYGAIAAEWAKRAAELRLQYGFVGGFAFSVAPNRIDGYSENSSAAEFG